MNESKIELVFGRDPERFAERVIIRNKCGEKEISTTFLLMYDEEMSPFTAVRMTLDAVQEGLKMVQEK
jgi:hypothetical protein